MRSKAVFVVGTLAVLLIGGVAWWAVGSKSRMVKERVMAVLVDPSSAEFRDVQYFTRNDVGCGFVNSKNRMGGMVGFKVFIAFPDGTVRFASDPGDPDYSTWVDLMLANCSEAK